VLDILIWSRRHATAAATFFGTILTGLRYLPGVIVTDKLPSYTVAHGEIMPSVEHRRPRYVNNRAERGSGR
jgi:putative transposase